MKFYGQWEYQVDKYIYDTFFINRKEPGFFIEAGANNGNFQSCCKFFEESLGWKGINVEAHPLVYDQLKSNRPLAINESYALSNQELSGKLIDFNIYYHPSYGTNHCINYVGSSQAQKKFLEEIMHFKFQKKVPVPCISYKDLLEKHKITQVDLFCLDVEGFELEVLQGMQGAPIPNVLCIEYGHLNIEDIKLSCSTLNLQYHSKLDNNLYFIKDKNI